MNDVPKAEPPSDIPMSDGTDMSKGGNGPPSRRDVGEMEHGDLDVAEDDDRWMR